MKAMEVDDYSCESKRWSQGNTRVSTSIRGRLTALEHQEMLYPSIRAMSDEFIAEEIGFLAVELHTYSGGSPHAYEFDGLAIAQLRATVAALPRVSAVSMRAMEIEEINGQMALLFALRKAELAQSDAASLILFCPCQINKRRCI